VPGSSSRMGIDQGGNGDLLRPPAGPGEALSDGCELTADTPLPAAFPLSAGDLDALGKRSRPVEQRWPSGKLGGGPGGLRFGFVFALFSAAGIRH
jgi:hypothetical protein